MLDGLLFGHATPPTLLSLQHSRSSDKCSSGRPQPKISSGRSQPKFSLRCSSHSKGQRNGKRTQERTWRTFFDESRLEKLTHQPLTFKGGTNLRKERRLRDHTKQDNETNSNPIVAVVGHNPKVVPQRRERRCQYAGSEDSAAERCSPKHP